MRTDPPRTQRELILRYRTTRPYSDPARPRARPRDVPSQARWRATASPERRRGAGPPEFLIGAARIHRVAAGGRTNGGDVRRLTSWRLACVAVIDPRHPGLPAGTTEHGAHAAASARAAEDVLPAELVEAR